MRRFRWIIGCVMLTAIFAWWLPLLCRSDSPFSSFAAVEKQKALNAQAELLFRAHNYQGGLAIAEQSLLRAC
jgi:hypothetical protein